MKKHIKLFVILSLLTSFSKIALAEKSYDDRYYISPSVTYLWLDDDRQTSRSGHGLGLSLGKAINKDINLELKAFYNRYQHQNERSDNVKFQWDTFGTIFDVQYFLSREDLAPYYVAAVGVMDSNTNNQNAVGVLGELGYGLAYKISENFSLKGDVRYRYNNNFNNRITEKSEGAYNDLVFNFGFVIPLGSKVQKAPKVVAADPIDSDHDGVYDQDDHCPNTARGVKVDEVGCKKQSFIKLFSNDNDNDGVENAKDQCPHTKKGVEVDKVGCKYKINLHGVNFRVNSADLNPEAKKYLREVAEEIKAHPNNDVLEIQGHTSSLGSDELNLRLSQARAQSVVNYLKQQGVRNQITAKGYGESNPIATNKTRAGRLQNRRVELFWK